MVRVRKIVTALAAALVLTILAIGVSLALWLRYGAGPVIVHETEAEVEASRPRGDLRPVLVFLDPGTRVEAEPPPGWSDLVIKSVLYLASGDLDTLPESARETATKFRTAVLADVRPVPGEPGSFHLSRVGAGLCLTIEGRDTVISRATLKSQGVSLSALDGLVLGRAEAALTRGRLAARTPTFALYETPVEFADPSGIHRSILLRYALLVDRRSGRLTTVCWPIPDPPSRGEPPETIRLLPPNLVFRCGLHVKAGRVVGRLAVSWKIAMDDLPPGRTVPMGEPLRSLSTRDFGSPEDSAELEEAVRRAVDRAGSPSG